jgi:hypothetical protein
MLIKRRGMICPVSVLVSIITALTGMRVIKKSKGAQPSRVSGSEFAWHRV